MSRTIMTACLACTLASATFAGRTAPPHLPQDLSPAGIAAADEHLWLEALDDARVRAFTEATNAEVARVLEGDPRFEPFRREAHAVLAAPDRIPMPRFEAGGVSVFWQDAAHPRGQWRRAPLDALRMPQGADWEVVLDLDALAAEADRDWVWKGADCLPPEARRCLVHLSIGGQDAVEIREYDTATRGFVDDGFHLPEGKSRVAWLDADTILVAADFGPGSLTESGYPYSVRASTRARPAEAGTERFRGSSSDGGYGVTPRVFRDADGGVEAVVFHRPLDTYRSQSLQWHDGEVVPLALPERVEIHGMIDGHLVFTPHAPWQLGAHRIPRGALAAVDLAVLRGDAAPPAASPVVFAPGPREAVAAVATTRSRIVVSLLDNVNGALRRFARDDKGRWHGEAIAVPANAAITLVHATRAHDDLFHVAQGFLLPPTLTLINVATGRSEELARSPPRFDATPLQVAQREAISRDGTRVPYFLVTQQGAMPEGETPTILFGYGGGSIPMLPQYTGQLGALWLARGGAYVLANIRGGGEFGPGWHQAAIQADRQRAFDDFAAVAEDLIDCGLTSPRRLGIYGRSNGGVLTSVSITQRPELFNAAVIESPVIDMLRYTELSAGASWIGEYGDPRTPDAAAYLSRYSAYQQVRPDAGYPRIYITTNRLDDRVHPGHARKFAARLARHGYAPLYFEDASGGHAYDADPAANARRWARHYVYFSQQLMD